MASAMNKNLPRRGVLGLGLGLSGLSLLGGLPALAAGNVADLIVVRLTGDDAYWSLTHTAPQDLELVVIGGQAIYGDAVLMKQMGVTHGEDFELCGAKKTILLTGTSFADTEKVLSHAMNQFGRTLAPISECGN